MAENLEEEIELTPAEVPAPDNSFRCCCCRATVTCVAAVILVFKLILVVLVVVFVCFLHLSTLLWILVFLAIFVCLLTLILGLLALRMTQRRLFAPYLVFNTFLVLFYIGFGIYLFHQFNSDILVALVKDIRHAARDVTLLHGYFEFWDKNPGWLTAGSIVKLVVNVLFEVWCLYVIVRCGRYLRLQRRFLRRKPQLQDVATSTAGGSITNYRSMGIGSDRERTITPVAEERTADIENADVKSLDLERRPSPTRGRYKKIY